VTEQTKYLGDGVKELLISLRRRLLQRGRTNRREIDDLIQEGYLRFVRYERAKNEPVRDPFAFLLQVVENLNIERARHANRTQQVFSPEPIEDVASPAAASTPEQELEAQELLDRIERRLAQANPRTRQALLMHRVEGLSYAEIAQRLGISTQAVTNHIGKALVLIDDERLRE